MTHEREVKIINIFMYQNDLFLKGHPVGRMFFIYHLPKEELRLGVRVVVGDDDPPLVTRQVLSTPMPTHSIAV